MIRIKALLLALAIYTASFGAFGQDPMTWVLIDVEEQRSLSLDRPAGEPLVTGVSPVIVWAVFHNGNFDAFDLGSPADEALRDFVNEAGLDSMRAKIVASDPDAVVQPMRTSLYGVFSAVNWALIPSDVPPLVNPLKHRYVSFLMRVVPTDDAFWGNDNPRQYELFDEAGNFKGPIVFDVFGDDLLDAGTRENLEQNLIFLDRGFDELDPNAGVPTSEPITMHPGLNGSLGNPEGQPQRVLDGSFVWPEPDSPRFFANLRYDREVADFTQPGHKLFQIKITSGIHEGYNGAWYDPLRDGEGFLLDVLHIDGRPHLSVVWFTYEPDGSGRQAFLTGIAPVNFALAEIELYQTEGGRFASTDNPATVQRVPWGGIRIGFHGAQCTLAIVDDISPLDSRWSVALGQGTEIYLERVAPLSRGAERVCARSVTPIGIF